MNTWKIINSINPQDKWQDWLLNGSSSISLPKTRKINGIYTELINAADRDDIDEEVVDFLGVPSSVRHWLENKITEVYPEIDGTLFPTEMLVTYLDVTVWWDWYDGFELHSDRPHDYKIVLKDGEYETHYIFIGTIDNIVSENTYHNKPYRYGLVKSVQYFYDEYYSDEIVTKETFIDVNQYEERTVIKDTFYNDEMEREESIAEIIGSKMLLSKKEIFKSGILAELTVSYIVEKEGNSND